MLWARVVAAAGEACRGGGESQREPPQEQVLRGEGAREASEGAQKQGKLPRGTEEQVESTCKAFLYGKLLYRRQYTGSSVGRGAGLSRA